MPYDSEKHTRRSIRIKGYDYTQNGYYFITICAHERQCLFGEIVSNKKNEPVCKLHEYGQIAEAEWLKTGQIRSNVILHDFVIMPNHMHGILEIKNNDKNFITLREEQDQKNFEEFGKPTVNSLPTIIRGYKSSVTKQIRLFEKSLQTPIWQRNYYENIIRDEGSYLRISEYIQTNAIKWKNDIYYSD